MSIPTSGWQPVGVRPLSKIVETARNTLDRMFTDAVVLKPVCHARQTLQAKAAPLCDARWGFLTRSTVSSTNGGQVWRAAPSKKARALLAA